jgi:hypothetical protein
MVPNGAVLGKVRRRIPLARLLELVAGLPPEIVLQPDCIGNLVVYASADGPMVGVVDCLYETISIYDPAESVPGE